MGLRIEKNATGFPALLIEKDKKTIGKLNHVVITCLAAAIIIATYGVLCHTGVLDKIIGPSLHGSALANAIECYIVSGLLATTSLSLTFLPWVNQTNGQPRFEHWSSLRNL
jgi:hypothetical protein